jgi:hypothetical protein
MDGLEWERNTMDIVTTNLVRLMNISHVAMIVGLSRAEKGVVVVGISWVEAGWKLGLPSSVQVVGNMDEGQYTRGTGASALSYISTCPAGYDPTQYVETPHPPE